MLLLRQLTIIALLVVLAFLCGCSKAPMQLPGTEEHKITAEPFFCPHDLCEQRVVAAIQGADESIDAAIYSFTSREIAGALIAAKARGVRVRVVADYLQSRGESSVLDELTRAGLKVRVYPRATTMHNKFAVIDNSLVITGSFNWTKSAAHYNRENFIILFGRGLAEEYENEFFRLWVEAS